MWVRPGVVLLLGLVLVPFGVPLIIGFTGWGLAVLVLLVVVVVLLVVEAFAFLCHTPAHHGTHSQGSDPQRGTDRRDKKELTGAGAGGGVAFLSCSK